MEFFIGTLVGIFLDQVVENKNLRLALLVYWQQIVSGWKGGNGAVVTPPSPPVTPPSNPNVPPTTEVK
jgi:hypothetical protein